MVYDSDIGILSGGDAAAVPVNQNNMQRMHQGRVIYDYNHTDVPSLRIEFDEEDDDEELEDDDEDWDAEPTTTKINDIATVVPPPRPQCPEAGADRSPELVYSFEQPAMTTNQSKPKPQPELQPSMRPLQYNPMVSAVAIGSNNNAAGQQRQNISQERAKIPAVQPQRIPEQRHVAPGLDPGRHKPIHSSQASQRSVEHQQRQHQQQRASAFQGNNTSSQARFPTNQQAQTEDTDDDSPPRDPRCSANGRYAHAKGSSQNQQSSFGRQRNLSETSNSSDPKSPTTTTGLEFNKRPASPILDPRLQKRQRLGIPFPVTTPTSEKGQRNPQVPTPAGPNLTSNQLRAGQMGSVPHRPNIVRPVSTTVRTPTSLPVPQNALPSRPPVPGARSVSFQVPKPTAPLPKDLLGDIFPNDRNQKKPEPRGIPGSGKPSSASTAINKTANQPVPVKTGRLPVKPVSKLPSTPVGKPSSSGTARSATSAPNTTTSVSRPPITAPSFVPNNTSINGKPQVTTPSPGPANATGIRKPPTTTSSAVSNNISAIGKSVTAPNWKPGATRFAVPNKTSAFGQPSVTATTTIPNQAAVIGRLRVTTPSVVSNSTSLIRIPQVTTPSVVLNNVAGISKPAVTSSPTVSNNTTATRKPNAPEPIKLIESASTTSRPLASPTTNKPSINDKGKINLPTHLSAAGVSINSQTHLSKAGDIINPPTHLSTAGDVINSATHLSKAGDIISSPTHLSTAGEIINSPEKEKLVKGQQDSSKSNNETSVSKSPEEKQEAPLLTSRTLEANKSVLPKSSEIKGTTTTAKKTIVGVVISEKEKISNIGQPTTATNEVVKVQDVEDMKKKETLAEQAINHTNYQKITEIDVKLSPEKKLKPEEQYPKDDITEKVNSAKIDECRKGNMGNINNNNNRWVEGAGNNEARRGNRLNNNRANGADFNGFQGYGGGGFANDDNNNNTPPPTPPRNNNVAAIREARNHLERAKLLVILSERVQNLAPLGKDTIRILIYNEYYAQLQTSGIRSQFYRFNDLFPLPRLEDKTIIQQIQSFVPTKYIKPESIHTVVQYFKLFVNVESSITKPEFNIALIGLQMTKSRVRHLLQYFVNVGTLLSESKSTMSSKEDIHRKYWNKILELARYKKSNERKELDTEWTKELQEKALECCEQMKTQLENNKSCLLGALQDHTRVGFNLFNNQYNIYCSAVKSRKEREEAIKARAAAAAAAAAAAEEDDEDEEYETATDDED